MQPALNLLLYLQAIRRIVLQNDDIIVSSSRVLSQYGLNHQERLKGVELLRSENFRHTVSDLVFCIDIVKCDNALLECLADIVISNLNMAGAARISNRLS